MAEPVKGVLQAKTLGFQWTIKRFFADCEKVGDFYTSPVFPVYYSDKTTQWYFEVYPKGEGEECEDYVSLFLHYQCEDASEVTVDYKCSIVSGKSSEVITRKAADTFKGPSENWGWLKFVEQAVIKDTEKGFLTNDTLTVLCEMTFLPMAKDIADKCYEYNEWQWLSKSLRKTITYEEFFESSSFSDVIFNVQDKKIHLHKTILSCRSPVFKAMFEHDMKEKKESSVDITDADYKVMRELFRFIYSGKVENIEKMVKELLIVADKYAIPELKALCEKKLYQDLTVDNAIEYLKVSDICDTPRLKKLMIKFVVDNLKDIVKKSNFKLMLADLNRDLVAEVMEAVAEKN